MNLKKYLHWFRIPFIVFCAMCACAAGCIPFVFAMEVHPAFGLAYLIYAPIAAFFAQVFYECWPEDER